MGLKTKHFYEFGVFRLDPVERVLLRQGEPLPLAPKVFETLLLLVRNNGHIVEREELISKLWADSFVEEGNLTYTISILRKTLIEASGGSTFIETVPKRGYRFKAIVREVEDSQTQVVIEKHTTASLIIEESDSEPQPTETLTTRATPGITQTETVFPAEAERRVLIPDVTSLPGKPRSKAILSLAVLLAVSVIAAVIWFAKSAEHAPALAVKSIAVLPFTPVGARGGDEYLELGMADALITKLSNIRQIVVRPTSAVRRYAEQPLPPVEAGKQLQVEAVLEGSIQRAGDQVRVTVQLVSVKNGAPIWAGKFDDRFVDIFAVQDSISEQVTRALALQLTGEERRLLAKRYTENTEAYQAYLRGRFHWSKWNRESLHKAIESFEQALAKDKDYALAYAGIADAYGVLGYLTILPPKEAYPKSKEAALKAVELDPTIGESYSALAQSKLFHEWDFAGAEKEIRRAIELSPNFADAHGVYGAYLTAVGKFGEALAERKRALELDPITPFTVNAVGWVYFYKRDYDAAIEWYKKAIDLDANFAIAHHDLGNVYYQKGLYAEAIEEFLKQKTLSGTSLEDADALRQAFHSSGVKGYWQKEFELAKRQMQQGRVRNWRMVRIYAELGDKDRAFEHLEKAFEERESLLIFLEVTPLFESLHSDKRFQDLLRRIGLRQ
jgi:TolB-like protein/DNA-binding winged helix-turn-helix (wHTH) protein/Tfp pilus assembly protein PilF